jgi:hypothetical protein
MYATSEHPDAGLNEKYMTNTLNSEVGATLSPRISGLLNDVW